LPNIERLNRYGLEGSDHTPPDDATLCMEGGNCLTAGMGTCIVSNDIPEDNAENSNNEAARIAEVEPLLKAYTWVSEGHLAYTASGHRDGPSRQ
jgi:hypothetical protein